MYKKCRSEGYCEISSKTSGQHCGSVPIAEGRDGATGRWINLVTYFVHAALSAPPFSIAYFKVFRTGNNFKEQVELEVAGINPDRPESPLGNTLPHRPLLTNSCCMPLLTGPWYFSQSAAWQMKLA